MAQNQEAETLQELSVPARMRADITLLSDVVVIGDWIVGYGRDPEESSSVYATFNFGGVSSEEWLTAAISSFTRRQSQPETVRRFVLRYGAFREWDWVEVAKALKSGLPNDVKEEIGRCAGKDRAVCLIRLEDFYREWDLLRILALIAGRLAERKNPLAVKQEAEAGIQVLRELRKNQFLPSPSTTEPNLLADLFSPDKKRSQRVPVPRSATPLPEQVRKIITNLLDGAFRRATSRHQYDISWHKFDKGPRISIEVRSILGVAYLVLLSNFSKGWKKCLREDCGNLFRVTDDKRKMFCSQYCGHLVSLRNKRRAERKGRQKRFKKGKR